MRVRLATAEDKDFKWIATAIEDIKAGDYVVLEEDEQVKKECCKKHSPSCSIMSLMSQLCCNKCIHFRKPPATDEQIEKEDKNGHLIDKKGKLKYDKRCRVCIPKATE